MGPGRWIAALLALTLLAAACGGEDDANGGSSDSGGGDNGDEVGSPPGTDDGEAAAPGEVVQVGSDVERETPQVGTAGVVDGDTAFAVDLYRELLTDDPEANLFFSPYSISVALAMTMGGARGKTYDEMASVLGAADGEQWHQARNALDQRLLREREGVEDQQPLQLEVANSVWGQSGYPFNDDYLDLLARHYGGGLLTVDFATAYEEARAAINAWVEDATNERIENLIPEGAIDDLTRMVLVNAIFFKANWVNQFDPDQTTDAPFRTPNGEVTVSMMHQAIRTSYGAGDGWEAIRLPYAGGASMLVIAPDEGHFDEIAEQFDSALISEVRSTIGDHQVDLAMPRFEVRSQFSLPEVLKRLGIVEAFVEPGGDSGADFTGIVDRREMFLTDVVHQAFVAVDEQGTEAAAATAVMFGITSAPPPAALTLDRPFIFLIEDDDTGAILFMGQVTDPTAG